MTSKKKDKDKDLADEILNDGETSTVEKPTDETASTDEVKTDQPDPPEGETSTDEKPPENDQSKADQPDPPEGKSEKKEAKKGKVKPVVFKALPENRVLHGSVTTPDGKLYNFDIKVDEDGFTEPVDDPLVIAKLKATGKKEVVERSK